jgi:hypothetical protein
MFTAFFSQISPARDEKIARVLIDVMSTEAKLGWDGLGRRRADESAHAERIVVEESNKA